MTVERLDHVGVVVEDLDAGTAFFLERGLELKGEAAVEGSWVDRVVGLDDVRIDIAMMQTPEAQPIRPLRSRASRPSDQE